jgi:hypothetical protein
MMDRFSDADPDERVEFWRTYNLEGATVRGEDDDLTRRIDEDGRDIDPSDTTTPGIYVDRRDREHVAYYQAPDGRWLPSRLKRGDDVICCGLPMRVICPGGDRSVFMGYYAPWFGDDRLPVEVQWVTERAPLDPQEEPMPVIPTDEPTQEGGTP